MKTSRRRPSYFILLFTLLFSPVHSVTWPWKKNNEKFMKWVLSHGGDVTNVRLSDDKYMGRGVYANAAVREGDPILTIPPALVVDRHSLFNAYGEELKKVPEKVVDQLRSPAERDNSLAVFLMIEKAKGKKSFYKPYIDVLPDRILRPITWNKDILVLLEDDAMAKTIQAQRDKAANVLTELLPVLKGVMGSNYSSENVSLERYLWALSVVTSRALTIRGESFLVPFADMFNYEPHPTRRPHESGNHFLLHHKRDAGGSFTITADRNTDAGQQLMEDYGDNPNSIYLEFHGFVPHVDNPFNCVKLDLAPVDNVGDEAVVMRKIKLLRSLQQWSSSKTCVGKDGVQTLDVRKVVAVMEMDVSALHTCESTVNAGTCKGLSELVGEGPPWAAIHRAASARLQLYSTSAEVDRQLLETYRKKKGGSKKSVSEMSAIAIAYRLAQKELLLDLIAAGQVVVDRIAAEARSTTSIDEGVNGAQDVHTIADVLPSNEVSEKVVIAIESTKHSLADAALVTSKWKGKEESQLTLYDKVDRFNAWTKALNFPVLKIEAAVIDKVRLGTVAITNIGENEPYISVPVSATIDRYSAAEDPKVGPIISGIRTAVLDIQSVEWDADFDTLLVYLVHEMFITAEEGVFWPYLSMFPPVEDFHVPLTFSEEDLLGLKGSEMFDVVRRYRSSTNTTFHAKWAAPTVVEASNGIITWERYLWATLVLDTRCIWWDNRRHLTPMLDLVNCGAPPGGRVHSTILDPNRDKAYTLTAAAWPFAKGVQVVEDYGYPNHWYFQYHGFIIQGNKHDCALVNLIPPPEATPSMVSQIRKLSVGAPQACISINSWSMSLIAYNRILAGLPWPPTKGVSYTYAMDKETIKAMVTWFEKRLAGYTRALATDEVLPPVPRVGNKALVAAFVDSEVDLLIGLHHRLVKFHEGLVQSEEAEARAKELEAMKAKEAAAAKALEDAARKSETQADEQDVIETVVIGGTEVEGVIARQ